MDHLSRAILFSVVPVVIAANGFINSAQSTATPVVPSIEQTVAPAVGAN